MRQILTHLAFILDQTKIALNEALHISFSDDKSTMTVSSGERKVELAIEGTSLTIMSILNTKKVA